MKISEMVKYAMVPLKLNADGVNEVAILADTDIEPEVYQSLAAAAFALGMEPTIVLMGVREVHGQEPTKVMTKALLGSDMMMFATSTGMAHTEAVRTALKNGVKYIGMPHLTIDTLSKGAATADYSLVQQITQKVAKIMTNSNEVRITSKVGTDITMSIKGRKSYELAGKFVPGSIACFPDGEAAMAPVEGTANGIIVVDSSMHQIGKLKEPIIITFKDGVAKKIEGDSEAEQLKKILETRGDQYSYCLGELAIGTNPKARSSNNVSEDKKQLGTMHIALGDNWTLGGDVRSSTHLDGIMKKPNLWVDGVKLIDNGQLILE